VKKKDTETAEKKKKRERKATKDLKLLSFGDEEEAFQEEMAKKAKKKAKTMASSHDLLDDRKFKSEVDAEVLQRVAETSSEAAKQEKKERSLASLKAAVAAASRHAGSEEVSNGQSTATAKSSSPPKDDKKKDRDEYVKLREELRQSKKSVSLLMGDEAKKQEKDRAFQDMLTPLQQQRQRYLQRKKATNRSGREQDTLSRLKKFQATLVDVNTKQPPEKSDAKPEDDAAKSGKETAKAESYHGQVLDDDDDDDDANDDTSWMTAKLKFKKHIDVSALSFLGSPLVILTCSAV
jgi:peptidyl-prolyl cis-trans isomerase SDCCAG10